MYLVTAQLFPKLDSTYSLHDLEFISCALSSLFLLRTFSLIRCFGVKYRRILLRVVLYFDEPADLNEYQRVSTVSTVQTTSTNIRRYFTPKHLHLLLFITRKYAIICVKRPSIARRDIHERESTNICA